MKPLTATRSMRLVFALYSVTRIVLLFPPPDKVEAASWLSAPLRAPVGPLGEDVPLVVGREVVLELDDE